MSSGRRSDLTILAVLGLACLMIIVAWVAWGPLRHKREREAMLRSTHSTNTEGAMVYYTLLDRLGFAVSRWDRSFDSDALNEQGVLVVLDERVIPPRHDEVLALRSWVTAGGVLVFSQTCHRLMELWDRDASKERTRWARPETERADNDAPSSRPDAATTQPTLLGVEPDESDFGENLHVLWGPSGPDDATDVEILHADSAGPRIAARPFGRGWLILLADTSFLANGRIGRTASSVLATNLASYAAWRADEGPIAFDEYHLGFGKHESGLRVMAHLLLHTSPGWSVLTIMVSGVLWIVYKGRKFGTRRGITRARRRSKLEYVHAVGETYRAAQAERIVLEQILRWFRRRVAELVGTSPKTSDRELARRLSRRTDHSPADIEQILHQCQQATQSRQVSSRHLSVMLNKLATLETETLDAHTRSE